MADDFAVLGVGRHPVPGSRREVGRAGLDDGVDALGDDAICFGHLGDLGEHVAFAVGAARLRLAGALAHRGVFLGGEALGRLAGLPGDLAFAGLWGH